MKKHQNIRFGRSRASHQNGASERAVKTMVTIESNMRMKTALRYLEETFSTAIWPMRIYYAIFIYNMIIGVQYILSMIEVWSRSRFEIVSETLSNFRVWGFLTCVLEPKLQNPGMKILRWDTRSQMEVNMGFIKMHSTQFGLVMNLLTG